MMIQRAILHILDFYSDVSVFSEAEIDLSDEAAAGYISKQMEKLQNNPSGRRGGFSPDSEFLADLRKYRSEELSFAEFSAQTARILCTATYHLQEKSVPWTCFSPISRRRTVVLWGFCC